MENKPHRIALVSQFLAILTHLYLTMSHFKLKFGLAEGKSLCNISDSLNCDAVSVSPFAVFAGTPVALWGLITNLVLFFGLISMLWNMDNRELRSRNLLLATGILVASIVMGLISATQLNTFCLFCILAYFFSGVTYWATARLNGGFNPFSHFQVKKFAAPVLSIPILAFGFNHVISTNMGEGLDRYVTESLQAWKESPNIDLGELKGLQMGAPLAQAKMLLVEFADFQCIHCKMASPTLKNFTIGRPDVALVFLSFPLDGKCNKAVPQVGDGLRCELAKAAYCANLQGKGWAAHEWIYENFKSPSLSDLNNYLEKLGMDVNKFRECRESAEADSEIARQSELGAKAGVQGTPTVLVNGRVLPRAVFLMTLEAAYNEIKSH